MVLVPLTDKVLKPVTASSTLLPSTALPTIARALPAPLTKSRVVTVLPVRVVLLPRLIAPL